MSPLRRTWQQLRETRDPASLRLLSALAVLATALAVYVLRAPDPWESSITKRLAAGKPLKLDHFVIIGLWWGALTGFLAALVALATLKWWSRPAAPVYPDPAPHDPRTRRWILFFVFAAMLLAVWPRSARLNHSLWNDEEYHLRAYVWGNWQPVSDGALRFIPVTWKEALFENEKGNHHIWASAEARLGHFLSGHGFDQNSTFSEAGLRIVPFTSGVLTVGVVVLLGAALGHPRAGLAAGLILALHPWHVRWSVELRGYSTMLLAITAGLLCLIQALRTNRWRWWLGYAAAQFLFLLCFAGSLYVAMAQNMAGFTVIFCARAPWPVRLAGAARLMVAGIFSLIPLALLMGPHVPQIAAYLKSANEYAPIGTSWFKDLWSHLVTGLRPSGDPPGTTLGIALPDLTASAPWRSWLAYGVIPLFLAGGLFALFRQDWRTRLVASTLLLAALLAVGHNMLSGSPFLTWYLLYLLPLFVLALVWLAPLLSRFRTNFPASLPFLPVILFSILTAPALGRITMVPRQPIREVVAAMRGTSPALQQADSRILTASFGDGARQMLSYDPRLHILKSREELRQLTEQAMAESRPLFLCIRGPAAMATEEPDLLAAVSSDPRWQQLDPVPGMEAMLSYDLYRFAPDDIGRIRLQP